MKIYAVEKPCGVEFFTIGDDDGMTYWCQRDDDKQWPQDHAVMIDGARFIIGYHEREDDDAPLIEAREVADEVKRALVFAQSDDFDTNELNHTL